MFHQPKLAHYFHEYEKIVIFGQLHYEITLKGSVKKIV